MFIARIDPKQAELATAADSATLDPWSPLLGAIIGEVGGSATEAQVRGFFQAVGQRIAARAPVDDIEDADALLDRINALWSALGWGVAAMTVDDDGIDIQHRDLPHMANPGDDRQWMAAVGPLLEGAYESWFRSMGSGPALHTRVTGQSGDLIELRHAI